MGLKMAFALNTPSILNLGLSLAALVTIVLFSFLVAKLFFKGTEIKEDNKESIEAKPKFFKGTEMKEENKESIEGKSKFFNTVINGLRFEIISTLDDIINIYEGIEGSTASGVRLVYWSGDNGRYINCCTYI